MSTYRHLDTSRRFILASLPAVFVGLGFVGFQSGQLAEAAPEIWQAAWLDRIGVGWRDPGVVAALVRGGVLWFPLLVTSVAVSRSWAEVFSRMRRRPLDAGWIESGWFFSLLLPATMPLPYAAVGMSFGIVFGSLVFGGTGRYVVNPALVGVVLLTVAYPPLFGSGAWLPGTAAASTWDAVNLDPAAAMADPNVAFRPLLLGREIGAIGTSSALACYAGAISLILMRVAAWPTVIAAVATASLTGWAAGALPWHWHLVIGQFAFLIAFIATDPTVQARTLFGRLAYGATFGGLTVVIRVADPSHPEGSAIALLLAMLCVPLFDYVARLAPIPRRRRRE